jgi:hypothetical protein
MTRRLALEQQHLLARYGERGPVRRRLKQTLKIVPSRSGVDRRIGGDTAPGFDFGVYLDDAA